jgi:hypothetical protein
MENEDGRKAELAINIPGLKSRNTKVSRPTLTPNSRHMLLRIKILKSFDISLNIIFIPVEVRFQNGTEKSKQATDKIKDQEPIGGEYFFIDQRRQNMDQDVAVRSEGIFWGVLPSLHPFSVHHKMHLWEIKLSEIKKIELNFFLRAPSN